MKQPISNLRNIKEELRGLGNITLQVYTDLEEGNKVEIMGNEYHLIESIGYFPIEIEVNQEQLLVLRNHLYNCEMQYGDTYQGKVLESILQNINKLEVSNE